MKTTHIADSEDHVSEKAVADGLAVAPRLAVLVVVRSGILRRTIPVAIAVVRCTVNQDLKALTLFEPPMAAYVQLMICGFEPFILNHLTKVGTTVESIKFDEFSACRFPLPPLAEQHRIVARVKELMKLCDALEQSGRLADEQHARLTSTLFDALAASESAHALAENWQRITEHFDLLLDRPEAIDALEQNILQLAVRGLLVPQDANNEPAGVLAEFGSLRNRGSDTEESVPPYEVPAGWIWCRLEEIASVGTGTTPSRTNSLYFEPAEVPWVTSGETGQPFIRSTAQAVSSLALRETSLKVYPVGTLIVAMYGQGKTRGQISELLIEASTNQACAAIVPRNSAAHHRRYIKLFFEENYDSLREESAGGAQPNLNVGKIKSTLIPLPPLAEQSRIVARVEELRRLCAQLRERLTEARRTQNQLAEALIAEIG